MVVNVSELLNLGQLFDSVVCIVQSLIVLNAALTWSNCLS